MVGTVPTSPTSNKLGNAALSNASSLMGLQVFSRLVTFVLNQSLVRLATPQAYGTVLIQLEPVLSTILFLSREGFRNALLRADESVVDEQARGGGRGKKGKGNGIVETSDEKKARSVRLSNIALLPIYLGAPIALVTISLYYAFASAAVKTQPYFAHAVALYAAAALIDLVSEPMHIRSVQALDPTTRVRAEGTGIIVRTGVTLAVFLYDKVSSSPQGTYSGRRGTYDYGNYSGRLGLLAFGLGQLAYATTLLAVFANSYGKTVSYKLRKPVGSNRLRSWFDENLLKVSTAMTAQGFLKHILTEGDKLIIARVSTLKDQGGYAVANNYGSLIARVFFQPVEESSRLYFSKKLSISDETKDNTDATPPPASAVNDALRTLRNILLFYTHMSLLLVSLAPPYLRLVLCAVLPGRYLNTSAPNILEAWVWYIPVLAINGILEAFVSSVATPSDLKKQSQWMAFFSFTYITATIALYLYTGLGDATVVYANALNLGARIIYCSSFLTNYFDSTPKREEGAAVQSIWHSTVPKIPVLVAFAMSAIITRASSRGLNIPAYTITSGLKTLFQRPCLIHLGAGVVCGLGCLVVCAISEREHFANLIAAAQSRLSRRKSKAE